MAEKKNSIRFSERTRILQRFNKKGEMVAEFSERTIILPRSSAKAKRLAVVKRLQELSDGLEISGAFANEMARIVMNWKKPKNRICRKPKVYVVTAKNDMLFAQTFETARKQLSVVGQLFKMADQLEIDSEGKTKLAREIRARYFGLANFPKDFPKLPKAYRDLFPMPARALRDWYAAYIDEPTWNIEEVSDETIKAFFDAKCAEAETETGQGKP